MDKEKEIWKQLFNGLKFIIYNNYEDLVEEKNKNDFAEISSYVMDSVIGILIEYFKKHPNVLEYIIKNSLNIINENPEIKKIITDTIVEFYNSKT
ncbi:MAG: hypothetical protein GYA14_14135 [Ignavibacteria bacterium]|nr:hypothetical protein [Ignavibacteria bacterium]